MKTKLLLLGLLAPCMLAAQSNGYVIEGTVGSITPKMVYIFGSGGSGFRGDSTVVVDGKFTFRGSVEDIVQGVLFFDHAGMGWMNQNTERDMLSIVIANENMKVFTPDSIKNGRITGSKINDEAVVLQRLAGNAMTRERNKDLMLAAVNEFLAAYPESPLGVNAVNYLRWVDADQATMQSVYNRLSAAVRGSKNGKNMGTTIAAMSNPQPEIGKPAFEFTQNDPNGNPVSLKDFRGRYLLIDFWASWCVPCRKENPHVVAAYEKYKGENFEILGVSLDYPGNHEKWMEAVAKDGLTWPQVSDLQGWNNAAAVLYCVKGIPANFLINPDGVIIGMNLRGESLEAKLAEIFGPNGSK